MKLFNLFLIFLALFFGFFTPTHASIFSRNLKLGDTGADVYSLQMILNKSTTTQVAQVGPGSPGNETYYFGSMTQNSVIRFQNLYSSDVLLPVGLSSGTGYVGEKTRAKLESLYSGLSVNQTNTVQTKTTPVSSNQTNFVSDNPTFAQFKNQTPSQISDGIFSGFTLSGPAILPKPNFTPQLYFIDPYETLPNSTITLHGKLFSTSSPNTIYIGGNYSITNLKSSDGSVLVVPLSSSLTQGKYEVWVTNSNGSSRNTQTPTSFIITNAPKAAPRIVLVSPTAPSISGNITISGKNFSATGNNIYSNMGSIQNLPSSDGKTISISLSSFPFVSKIKGNPSISTVPLWLTVQNENGVDRIGYRVQVTNI